MSKSKSLSSDIDFIKEFEELRIKQKLLVESLSRKKKGAEVDLLQQIDAKLEFLVKLFQDTGEDDSHDEFVKEKFENLNTRLEDFEKKVVKTIQDLADKIESNGEKDWVMQKKEGGGLVEGVKDLDEISKSDKKEKNNLKLKYSDEKLKLEVDTLKKEVLPNPDFKVESLADDKKKDKKKWF